MSAFKVGDRVRVKPTSWPYPRQIGQVESVEVGDIEVAFDREDGTDYMGYRADELELVEAAPQENQP